MYLLLDERKKYVTLNCIPLGTLVNEWFIRVLDGDIFFTETLNFRDVSLITYLSFLSKQIFQMVQRTLHHKHEEIRINRLMLTNKKMQHLDKNSNYNGIFTLNKNSEKYLASSEEILF